MVEDLQRTLADSGDKYTCENCGKRFDLEYWPDKFTLAFAAADGTQCFGCLFTERQCLRCNGSGEIEDVVRNPATGKNMFDWYQCPKCNGDGSVLKLK